VLHSGAANLQDFTITHTHTRTHTHTHTDTHMHPQDLASVVAVLHSGAANLHDFTITHTHTHTHTHAHTHAQHTYTHRSWQVSWLCCTVGLPDCKTSHLHTHTQELAGVVAVLHSGAASLQDHIYTHTHTHTHTYTHAQHTYTHRSWQVSWLCCTVGLPACKTWRTCMTCSCNRYNNLRMHTFLGVLHHFGLATGILVCARIPSCKYLIPMLLQQIVACTYSFLYVLHHYTIATNSSSHAYLSVCTSSLYYCNRW